MRRLLALSFLALATAASAQNPTKAPAKDSPKDSAKAPAKAAAKEFGKLPYATIEDNLERTAGSDRSKLAVRLMVTINNPDLKMSDIVLTLESKSGPVRIPIGFGGGILDFPRTEALRQENPFLFSNQPKGAITLTVDIGVPLPADTTFPYQHLVSGLAEVNNAVKRRAGSLSSMAASSTKVVLYFADPEVSVTVPGKSGPTTMKADSTGKLVLPLDPELAKDNAKVTVGAPVRWIGTEK